MSFTGRAQLFTHYRLQHSQFSVVSPLPCLYDDCMCTFKSLGALGTHLSRNHTAEISSSSSQEPVSFEQPFSESGVLYHLRRHLKNHETVLCPYKNSNYSTNVASTFNSHKIREHQPSLASDVCSYTVSQSLPGTISEVTSEVVPREPSPGHENTEEEDAQCDTDRLKDQLKHNAASLFLKMQTILHVSNTATQEIVDHLNEHFSLSKPLVREAVNEVLQHGHNVTDSTLDEVVRVLANVSPKYQSTLHNIQLGMLVREILDQWPALRMQSEVGSVITNV